MNTFRGVEASIVGGGQAHLLFFLNGKPVFRVPDISCLRNVNFRREP